MLSFAKPHLMLFPNHQVSLALKTVFFFVGLGKLWHAFLYMVKNEDTESVQSGENSSKIVHIWLPVLGRMQRSQISLAE